MLHTATMQRQQLQLQTQSLYTHVQHHLWYLYGEVKLQHQTSNLMTSRHICEVVQDNCKNVLLADCLLELFAAATCSNAEHAGQWSQSLQLCTAAINGGYPNTYDTIEESS